MGRKESNGRGSSPVLAANQRSGNEERKKKGSLVDVVVVFVVTAQGDEGTDAQAVREEDLRDGVHPHLPFTVNMK